MNISNQLLLGIVFITAGVAMALLAYAAFLNRDAQEAESEQPEDVDELAGHGEAPESDSAVDAADSSEPASETPTAGAAVTEAAVETIAAETIATAAGEQPADEHESAPMLAEPTAAAAREPELPQADPPLPAEPLGPASARLLRDEQSGRLVIEVGSKIYRSMSELQTSEDWNRVDGLFGDLIAWLYPSEPPIRPKADPVVVDADAKDEAPPSMIDQINEILDETLSHRTEGPQAVRLMEGSGGSIRVMIGVNSYSLEEVPDEEVKRVIRQAVAEWEARS